MSEQDDYADPECPSQVQLRYDLKLIVGALIISGLSFLPPFLLLGFAYLAMRF